MRTLTMQDVHQTNTNTYEAQASQLGLQKGEWPDLLTVMTRHYTDAFRRTTRLGDAATVPFVLYRSGVGGVLRVYNDWR